MRPHGSEPQDAQNRQYEGRMDVEAFHAEYDHHTDDRIRLFRAIADTAGSEVVPSTRVLYPGSYVDIAPSVWFHDVTYVDTDKRAARFFAQADDVDALIAAKRRSAGGSADLASITFHCADYRDPLPLESDSFGLLISLYAGFISEHCTDLLAVGGRLLVNSSHGDAAMASIDPRYELSGVVVSGGGDYQVDNRDLGSYLEPKRPQSITVDSLHESGRGIAYTRSPFAYLFTKVE